MSRNECNYLAPGARLVTAVSSALIVVSICACRGEPPPSLPPTVAALVEQQKWEDAIPILKKHLLVCPEDVAAHYYLGACYLNLRDPILAIAEGEFQVALTLFRRNGMASPIDGVSPRDFELRCHLGLANVYIRSLAVVTTLTSDMSIISPLVHNLGMAVANAASIAPDDPRVERLQTLVDKLMRQPGAPPPAEESQARVSA